MSEGFSSVIKTAGMVGAAITGAASSVLYMAERMNQGTAQLGRFSQLTGLSSHSVQALGYAAEQTGGSFQSVQNDLMGLTRSMESPVPGEFNQALFMLGINTRKASGELRGADDILMEVADKFQGMSRMEQLNWGSKLGLSNDTILLLQSGSSEISRLKREAESIPTIVGEKNIKNAQLFVANLARTRRMLSYIGQVASSAAGPALERLTDRTGDFLKENRELIELGLETFIEGVIQGFEGFGNILKAVKDRFQELFPGVGEFVSQLWNSQTVAAVVEAGLVALSVALVALLAPYALVAAGVVAASLVLNDFISYMQGGNSVIGEMIEWVKGLYGSFAQNFPEIAAFIEAAIEWVKGLAMVFAEEFGKMIESPQLVIEWITEMYDAFADKFPGIVDFIKMLGRVFKDLASITVDVAMVAIKKYLEMWQKFAETIGYIYGKIVGLIEKALQKAGFGGQGDASEQIEVWVDGMAKRASEWREEEGATWENATEGLSASSDKMRSSVASRSRGSEGSLSGSAGSSKPSSSAGLAKIPEGTTSERMRQGMRYYTSKGFTKEQAAGIMGNLYHESGGLNPAIKEKGGSGFGLAQWTTKDRRAGLAAYAQSKGKEIDDYQMQLEYVLVELEQNKAYGLEQLKQAKSAEEAAKIFSDKFERPGIPHMDRRMKYANAALAEYSPAQQVQTASLPEQVQTAQVSSASNLTTNSTNQTINITNNITGGDPEAIAQQTTAKMNYALQQTYPGGLAPVAG